MKRVLIRFSVTLTFMALLAGCKGCTVIPKTEETSEEPRPEAKPGSYRDLFLDILQNKSVPRSLAPPLHAFARTETFRYESDAELLRILGPSSSPMGSYQIRQGSLRSGINLQAPHADSDLMTGEIAAKLCREQRYDSCSTNTMHRRKFDFAHEPNSPFQDFTAALVTYDPKALIVQLHGFEGSKRRQGPEQRARMILSTGHDYRALQAALHSLRLDKDPSILVFGLNTRELGATRNVQAGLLKSLGKGHFLHIETSSAFREKLQHDRKERDFLDRIIRTVKKKYDEQTH